jgi:hypothetical protein
MRVVNMTGSRAKDASLKNDINQLARQSELSIRIGRNLTKGVAKEQPLLFNPTNPLPPHGLARDFPHKAFPIRRIWVRGL